MPIAISRSGFNRAERTCVGVRPIAKTGQRLRERRPRIGDCEIQPVPLNCVRKSLCDVPSFRIACCQPESDRIDAFEGRHQKRVPNAAYEGGGNVGLSEIEVTELVWRLSPYAAARTTSRGSARRTFAVSSRSVSAESDRSSS